MDDPQLIYDGAVKNHVSLIRQFRGELLMWKDCTQGALNLCRCLGSPKWWASLSLSPSWAHPSAHPEHISLFLVVICVSLSHRCTRSNHREVWRGTSAQALCLVPGRGANHVPWDQQVCGPSSRPGRLNLLGHQCSVPWRYQVSGLGQFIKVSRFNIFNLFPTPTVSSIHLHICMPVIPSQWPPPTTNL